MSQLRCQSGMKTLKGLLPIFLQPHKNFPVKTLSWSSWLTKPWNIIIITMCCFKSVSVVMTCYIVIKMQSSERNRVREKLSFIFHMLSSRWTLIIRMKMLTRLTISGIHRYFVWTTGPWRHLCLRPLWETLNCYYNAG